MIAELAKILLVEDNPNDAELTMEALHEYRIANSVVTAEDGEEALDYLYCRGKYADRPRGNPAVILLDLKLPKVDGHEVLRAIRADDTLKLIPVVVLTSSHEEKDLIQSYGNGANAYVVKPVDFHDFIDAVKELGAFWGMVNSPPPNTPT